MRNTLILAAVLAIGAAFYFYSCSNEAPVVPGTNLNNSDTVKIGGNGSNCVPIMAGQFTNAGTICFTDVDTDNDHVDDALRICYTTINGWELTEAHFHLSTTLAGIPMTKKGNPIPGQFAYNSGDITGQTSYCITVPFSTIGITCPSTDVFRRYYAAHCVVRKLVNGVWQTETGWGQGPGFSGGNWAMYNWFDLTCDTYTPPPQNFDCETAFAFGGNSAMCFFDPVLQGAPWNLEAERWGWTNGPLSAGTYNYNIYAGAGQCNQSNGTLVGTLTIVYNGSSATVTYNMNSGYTMDETHLFAGNDPLPYFEGNGPNHNGAGYSVAPGHYGNIHDLTNASTDSYTITGLSGNIYIIAHAVVCGNY